MRYLIWNDEPEILEEWKSLARSLSFGMTSIVEGSSTNNIEDFTNLVKQFNPDVILLDIVAKNGERVHGINIAQAIRYFDKLVPILAITRDPSAVYQLAEQNETISFAGVYHASIMEKGAFWASALRPSLNNWSLMAPDYSLVRQITRFLNVEARNEAVRSRFKKIRDTIGILPLHGDTDAWHGSVSKEIRWILESEGLGGLAKAFDTFTELFQKADPFYMANTRSRKHLSHNVQVFFLGLLILLSCDEVKEAAIKQVNETEEGLKSEDHSLLRAILLWACVALTHDTAYLSEVLESVCATIANLGTQLRSAFGPEAECVLEGLKQVRWPKTNKELAKNTHPEVGSRLWQKLELPQLEKTYAQLIGNAISRHDSKIAKDKSPVHSSDWLSFLAVLSDELQDWGRTRSEEFKKWRLFSLEHVSLDNAQGQVRFNLLFVAIDHPALIGDSEGKTAAKFVEESFRYSAKNIRDNLRSSSPFEVILRATFPTRPFADDIRESAKLAQA